MFLDIDDISNRSRTSVTLLLVLIALLQTVKKDFPKTTEKYQMKAPAVASRVDWRDKV